MLDLRGNGGGLLNEAVLCASLFLHKGQLVVSTDSRTMGHHDYDAVGNPLPTHPTVVLINHDTASAAEILASALGDHHLATIVGTRSFGKGTFQEVLHLRAGGALDLTVGEYLTADGTSLAGKGITPDVTAVDNPKTPRTRASQGARGSGGEGGGREQVSPRRAAALGRRVASVERRGRFASPSRCSSAVPRRRWLADRSTWGRARSALVDFGPGGARALRALGSAERRARRGRRAALGPRAGRGFPAGARGRSPRCGAGRRRRSPPRRDLTGTSPTFTVDPATARDFDDAVSAEAEGDGVRLWIHIADVSAHVRPGGGLDAEALRRGTSTYVPGRSSRCSRAC